MGSQYDINRERLDCFRSRSREAERNGWRFQRLGTTGQGYHLCVSFPSTTRGSDIHSSFSLVGRWDTKAYSANIEGRKGQ